jgi:hypothetical protein
MKKKSFSMRFAALLLIVFFVACKKKAQPQNNNPVPYAPVALSIYPNDPLNFQIQSVGGWKYIDGGINGILVYRKSEQEFVAIERTSSVLPDNKLAKVYVQSDNFTLSDTVSKSEWRIFDGAVSKGASWPLRVYGSTFDGNLLRIVN